MHVKNDFTYSQKCTPQSVSLANMKIGELLWVVWWGIDNICNNAGRIIDSSPKICAAFNVRATLVYLPSSLTALSGDHILEGLWQMPTTVSSRRM